ncbi:16S rRNA (adenine(1518)-N(6)/adenine(1519)-N(6))-dimethyltransferase RsmA [Coralliovum pocilloporae]|uniref:16S rRNA (adenine(1518)-N(6)/adenine(1519)-N(6))- dimethyltransferase RsmA n=1 Tax=Coralliovum pocilloporae TaxID=3066369 RepID=UPI0033072CAC
MAQIDNLPPLRDVIRQHGLNAKKTLGQNFLLDLNLTLKIAKTAGSLEGRTVVEVGPGPGGLTRAILAAGADKVIAIEKDQRCLPALQEIADAYPGKLDVIDADALTVDMTTLVSGPARIIANLPYNVATPLLINWLKTDPWPPWYESMTLMFQKEVAQRIVAEAGEKAYGRLGVLSQWRTDAFIAFDVPPSAFTPPPKVTSSIVHLVPKDAIVTADAEAVENLTAAAFGQRRKMLRQSLKSLEPEILAYLEDVGIEPTERAEQVPVPAFLALAQMLSRNG